MAFTNRGLQQAMTTGINSTTRYLSLHLTNNTELSGHGYARASITTAQMSASNAGVITGPTNHPIYTANDATAQRAMRVALYDAASRAAISSRNPRRSRRRLPLL